MELKFIRKIAGATQHGLVKAAGFSCGKMSLAERGYVSLSDSEKKKIAKFLSVDVDRIDWPKT